MAIVVDKGKGVRVGGRAGGELREEGAGRGVRKELIMSYYWRSPRVFKTRGKINEQPGTKLQAISL